jgi:hypothetical protein
MPKDPIKELARLEGVVDSRVARCLWRSVSRMKDRLKRQLLAGSPIHKRTKGLPVLRERPRLVAGGLWEAGVRSPVDWARVHFGPLGTAFTIHPKGGHKFLAIPTDFVKTFRGHPVGPKQYSGTVIFGGIIWGKAGWKQGRTGGGLRQHRAAGEKFGRQALIPLYILKKSVVVRRRIDPRALIAWERPHFREDLRRELLK